MNQLKPNSQTTQRLNQHPTPAEMQTPRRAYVLANLKEFSVFIVLSVISWIVVSAFLSTVVGG